MILTVTLNLALDVTYRVRGFAPEASIRVDKVEQRAGGKGVNVARVLHQLGEAVVVTGFVAGATGVAVRADLDAAGIPHDLEAIEGDTRRTVAIVDPAGRVTILLEPGPEIAPEAWSAMQGRFDRQASAARVVVISGSQPRGLPADASAVLTGRARTAGTPVILDGSGDSFTAALASRPTLVKPNRDELYEITGGAIPAPGTPTDLADVASRAALLRSWGAGAVAVSLGPGGMLLVTDDGAWLGALPRGSVEGGNPTGAGDAAVAALARGLATGSPWPASLIDAVALSAAAVLHPLAGGFDAAAYARFSDLVELRPLAGAEPQG
jgi:1-phosphofructokinase family hexose kinase